MPTPRIWKDDAERKRAYRLRQKREAAARAAAPVVNPEPPEPPEPTDSTPDSTPSPVMQAVLSTNPNATTLAAIRDDPNALNADRLRAAVELGKLEALESQSQKGGSELRDLRAIIEALPVNQRLPYLKGEVDAHRAAGAYTKEEK